MDGGRKKLWLTCDNGHTWSALDLPADMGALAKVVRRVSCPTCGLSKRAVKLAREAEIVAVEGKR